MFAGELVYIRPQAAAKSHQSGRVLELRNWADIAHYAKTSDRKQYPEMSSALSSAIDARQAGIAATASQISRR
jgi:hypothetical protein